MECGQIELNGANLHCVYRGRSDTTGEEHDKSMTEREEAFMWQGWQKTSFNNICKEASSYAANFFPPFIMSEITYIIS